MRQHNFNYVMGRRAALAKRANASLKLFGRGLGSLARSGLVGGPIGATAGMALGYAADAGLMGDTAQKYLGSGPAAGGPQPTQSSEPAQAAPQQAAAQQAAPAPQQAARAVQRPRPAPPVARAQEAVPAAPAAPIVAGAAVPTPVSTATNANATSPASPQGQAMQDPQNIRNVMQQRRQPGQAMSQ